MQRLLVPTAELFNEPASVCRAIVDEEQDSAPSSQCELEKPDELALAFAFAEHIREPPLGSCSEYVGADVFVVDKH